MKSILLSLASTLLIFSAEAPAAAACGGYQTVWDDFHHGFSVDTPGARWLHFGAGPFIADDGVPTTSCSGLSVVPTGENPVTHAPAFMSTMGQETGALSAFDHLKWLVIMNHFSSNGFVGFDAEPGRELACETVISGQVFGTHQHPFGHAVADPDSDPRLGAVFTSAFDAETFVIFNFLVTNEMIYAFYERAPFARTAQDDYASFAYAVPVMWRWPHQRHRLKIAYDKSRGRVRWLIDGQEVFRLNTIGARINRQYMLIDRGGDNRQLSLDQLDCGMGMLTMLDGYGPTNRGLVQIDPDAGSYSHPRWGEPFPMSFVDDDSHVGNRLFGQGAAMQVSQVVVSSRFAP